MGRGRPYPRAMTGRAVRREQDRILAEALARARAAAPYGLAVFDLDSTLLDNRPRQARIVQDYGRAHGLPLLLGARPEHWRGWDLRSGLLAAGLPAREVRRHHARFRRFWAERFFTSAFCRFDVPVAVGQQVRAGDLLLTLEAMKMELPIRAPRDGIVTAIRCAPGELVQPGPPLVEIT